MQIGLRSGKSLSPFGLDLRYGATFAAHLVRIAANYRRAAETARSLNAHRDRITKLYQLHVVHDRLASVAATAWSEDWEKDLPGAMVMGALLSMGDSPPA